MARAVAVLEICGVAEAAGVCERRTRIVGARGNGFAGIGAVPPASRAIGTSAARVAASPGCADGRFGPDRPFPLPLFRTAAEHTLSALAGNPDLVWVAGVWFRFGAGRSTGSD